MMKSFFLSRHTDLQKALVRGARLLGLGYILNCLRGTLPLWLGLRLEAELGVFTPLSVLWMADILQFAGLAVMFLAVVRHFKISPYVCIVLAGLVALIAPLIWGLSSGNWLLDGVLNLLWGDNGELVAFPLFPWLCYSLVGAGFGQWLVTTDNRPRLFRCALHKCACLCILRDSLGCDRLELVSIWFSKAGLGDDSVAYYAGYSATGA